MNEKEKVKYGEIYLYDFGNHNGSVQNGFRPSVIVQDNRFNENSPTTIIAAVTSVTKKQYLPSHVVLGERFGLTKPSMVLLEQIACVNQDELGDYIGVIDDAAIKKAIRCGLKKTFGLWDYRPHGTADVRCLCAKCLRDYIQSGGYIVRRLDPFAKSKNQCDKCDASGYDYILTQRREKSKEQLHESRIRTFEMEANNE